MSYARDPAAAEIAPPLSIQRTAPVPPGERAANVKRLLANIQAAKQHFAPDFQRMRWAMDFAAGLQLPDQRADEPCYEYVVNLTLRHLHRRTSILYAKNPTASCRRKPRLDYRVWDGSQATLQNAMQLAQSPDPAQRVFAQEILEDYQQGYSRRQALDRVARSLELLFERFMTEPVPPVKIMMKQLVRRVLTCGVGYAKLGYQRILAPRPDVSPRYDDLATQLAVIERLRANLTDQAAVQYCEHEAEQLRVALAALQREPEAVLREGPTLEFPQSTSIIPDPATRYLKGWVGTAWVAEQFDLRASQVAEIYQVDLTSHPPRDFGELDAARVEASVAGPADAQRDPIVRVYQYYELATRTLYTVAEGWPDYLEEPRPPDVHVEQFFPYYVLSFNDIEHEKRLFPPSDVELLRHVQEEYNRVRESLRQHRIANRPLYVSPTGAFDQKDRVNLTEYSAHDVVSLNALKEGQAAAELLQPVQKVPIDPAAYEVESLFADMLRITGMQEANIGGVAGATATEASIAESSRLSAVASEADDMDDFLTRIARDFGQVCLREMSAEQVRRIAGPGAVWPEQSRAEYVEELDLVIEAGSSGRPDRDRALRNFERAAPFLLQIPGLNVEALSRYAVRLLDDRIPIDDFIAPGAPSVVAVNQQMRPLPADPAADPAAQGPEGAGNLPRAPRPPQAPRPAFDASGNEVPGG
ncbi:MAG: hypothetical protein N2036_12640 [Bryobacteraceae bacterium]|nr:hypothetical protein [Bryobacteraceae bacterium]